MRSRIVLIVLVFISLNVQSQELEKAPKQISVELGYRYMLSNDLVPDGGSAGYGFMIDYAWKLSGYTPSKRAVYLSVPLGYTILPGSTTGPSQRMLNYGWAVRHMIGKGQVVQPYVGYGLLLNQVSVEDREGQLFGHQTRFALGSNFNHGSLITPYITVEYSMARHPQLDIAESSWLHFIELKAGIRIK